MKTDLHNKLSFENDSNWYRKKELTNEGNSFYFTILVFLDNYLLKLFILNFQYSNNDYKHTLLFPKFSYFESVGSWKIAVQTPIKCTLKA
jgi:hypothetical protein